MTIRPSRVAGSNGSRASCSEPTANHERRRPDGHTDATPRPTTVRSQVVTARTLFDDAPPGRRNAGERRPDRVDRAAADVLLARRRRRRCATRPPWSSASPTTTGRPGRTRSPVYAYPGWFSLAMGGLARVADDNVKLMLGRIRIDLSPRRHRADDRLVGRLVDHPRRRRQLVRAVAGDPPLPATGPSCTAPATRTRWPTDGSCGRSWGRMGRDVGWHAGVSVSDRRRRAVRAADDHRPGRRPRLQRHRRDPARRRSLPGRRPRTPDPPERLLDLRDEGATWSPIRPTAVQGLEHQAVPAALRRRSCAPTATRIRRSAASASA